MSARPSLVSSLRGLVDEHGDWPLYTFLDKGDWDGPRTSRSAAETDAAARRIAGALQAAGLAGKPAVLLYPPGMAFVDAFYACLYSGVIAVPAWPPDPARLARTLPRLVSIAEDAGAAAVLTTTDIAGLAAELGSLAPALAVLPWIATDAFTMGETPKPPPQAFADAPPFFDRGHGDVAFLQYTSGSTGDPKGVVVTHENLLANIAAVTKAYRFAAGDVVVSWLPQYHDMGLIGNILTPALAHIAVVQLSPADFLRRPLRWAAVLSGARATVTGGPDFGWALLARKITEAEAAALDLRALRVAYSGAEPVRAETIAAVERRLGPAGFPRGAWQPVYGLAESTLIVTGGVPAGGAPVVRRIDPAGLEARAVRAGERPIVGCGREVAGLRVRIVDAAGRAAPDDAIGEIVVSGSSVAAGYWRKPEATEAVFGLRLEGDDGAYLRTGDLGFLHEGELFVTGRAKDLLIVRGRNLYPQDLESMAVAAHPAVRQGCVAAFGHERDGEEHVGLAAEIDPGRATDGPERVVAAIRAAIAEQHDVVVEPILLLEPRGLPKTSSGKVQRGATRDAWRDGVLPVLHHGTDARPAVAPPEDPVLRRLIREVAAWTGQPEAAIDPEATFRSLSLDSLRLVDLANAAEQASGVRVEMTAIYDHPTLSALAAHVRRPGLHDGEGRGGEPVAAPALGSSWGTPEPGRSPRAPGALRGASPGHYPGLDEGRRRIDARSTDYQYDIERDIAWDTFGAPGLYARPAMLAGLGLDVGALEADPEAMALAQWGMALAVCVVFEWLEVGVIRFIERGEGQMGSARSLDLFVEEEHKHIATFRRFRERLEAARPLDVPAFQAALEPTLQILRRFEPDPVASTMANNPSLSLVEAHYIAWLHATFFEAYTVWFHEALDGSAVPPVQPLWLRIHELHRQEEVQHLGTDSVHMRHIAVRPDRRMALSAAFCALLARDFDHLFGIDAVVRLVRERGGRDVRSADPYRVQKAVQSVLAVPILASLRREAPFIDTALALAPERLLPEALRAARSAQGAEGSADPMASGSPRPQLPDGRGAEAKAGAAGAHDDDAIAIVGIGCRFPGGARDPEAFFAQLVAGTDAIREVPRSRWDVDAWYDPDPDVVGKMNTRWGGFIDGVEDFDPLFFGVAPREARAMDPQQRVLLEVAWEALEDAGIPPSTLLGTPAGVFVGIASWDYSRREVSEPIGPWSATGVALSIAAGRISYLLGLTGPSLSVDTACSSALVAAHLAVRSLRSGECNLAIVGGVQLLLYPETTVGFTRLRAMSPTGRCRTFDADADGYVRSDGCGVVVLKRLADARRDGDRIHALIRGTAVNQDGRSNGLTAPSGAAQQAVMRAALADAGVDVADLGYVEAHGTGTPLGDPIELGAIGAVATARSEDPLWVGSVKSAIGHCEAASGLAGLIKVSMAIRHGIIPPNLHFRTPNPRVPWAELPLRVPTETVPWPAGPRFAGVSSFGFGGTNAHVVLGEAPCEPEATRTPSGVRFLAISAPDDAGLAAVAGRLRDHLGTHPEANIDDVAHAALAGRNTFPRRAAVLAPDRDAALAGLSALAAGQAADVPPTTAREGLRVGFLFTGQGAQYAGMGATLAAACPVFRDALDRSSAILGPRLGRPLRALMDDPEAVHETGVTQPAMIALALALAETWRSFGVEPALVMGHSVGEIAAAAVAGVFDLPAALALIEARARLMQALPKGGAMVAVEVDEQTALSALGAEGDRVAVAVINGPSQVVISGDAAGVEAVVARLEAKAGRSISRRLQVSHAFHSPLMEPMLDDFEAALRGLPMKRPSLPLVSNVTGALAGAEVARPGYWSMHVRAPVRFAAGIRTAVESGIDAFVEIGPHPTLLALCAQAFPGVVLLPSLRRGQDDRAVLSRSVASLWAAGGKIDARAVLPGRRTVLPTWPFARQRCWLEEAPAGAVGGERLAHPLLGRRLDVAGPAIFETTLSREAAPLLAEHLVDGAPVLPAAAWAELARAAAAEARGGDVLIEDLRIEDALRWPEPVRLQAVVDGETVTISTRRPEGWHVHARAAARPSPLPEAARVALDGIAAPDPFPVDYAAFEAAGLGYGPAFQGLRSLHAGDGVAIGEIVVPEIVAREKSYGLHPAVLDAAFQACSALLPDVGLALPVSIARLTLDARPEANALAVVVRSAGANGAERRFDLDLCEQDGRRVARVEGLVLRVVRKAAPRSVGEGLTTTWEALPRIPLRAPTARRRVLGVTPLADAVTKALPGDTATNGGKVDEVVFLAEGRTLAEGLDALFEASCTMPGRLVVATTGAFALDGAGHDEGGPQAHGAAPLAPEPVTMGTTPPSPEAMAAQRGMWCFARSVALERPGRVRLVDLDPALPEADRAAALVEESAATDAEDQVARRGSLRFGARLSPLQPTILIPPPEGGFRLGAATRGSVENLALAPAEERAPGHGEVRIAVEAAGLNFRDVLNVLGMYPGDPGPLGGECTGRIDAVGPGVSGFGVGDAVVAIVPGAFARKVVVDARLVAPRPKGWSAAEAATLPVAFTTAWHGLYDLAALHAGQVVLVHAAAGGVGLAAIQLARRVGARVLGTTSAGKQAAALAHGAEKVASSREPGFSAAFGEPVDVVLNSLTGPFIPESLRALRPGGAFLEMGKAEIWTQAQVDEVRQGVAYRPFDLAALPIDELSRLLRAVASAADRGEIRPLPRTCFSLARSVDAFRHMAAARHVGKVVIACAPILDAEQGSWVVTGGTGAVGGALSLRLVALGVRRIVLAARRAEGEAVGALLGALREAGAEAVAVAADVSSAEGIERIAAVAGDVRGIVHAAGILDDALAQDLTPARIGAVRAPKADAAVLLAARWPDAVFVATSSVAAAFGSPGQAAYAAANGALDGLVTALAARGRTARSLQYGPWAGAGMAAATRARQRNAVQGLVPLDPAEGARWLGLSLAVGVPVLGVATIDRKRLATRLGGRVPPLLSGLGLGAAAPAGKSLAAELEAAPPAERRELILRWLRRSVGRVVGAPPEAIDVRRPLRDFGLDSLMAVELQGHLATALVRDLPRTLLVDHPTLDSLATFLVGPTEPPRPVAHAPAPAPRPAPRETAPGDEVGAALAELEALLDRPAPMTVDPQQVLSALRRARERILELEQRTSEPIAVVGRACRFAGAGDTEALWRLCVERRTGIRPVPPERWWGPRPADATFLAHAAWLDDFARFDAEAFGISPAEAAGIDPQQRMLLELSAGALERAGHDRQALAGSATGVFFGICNNDYAQRFLSQSPDRNDAWMGTGNAFSIASGRVAYALGLAGPAITVDTACSSSLLAVHLACQSLRSRESDLAVAGGASVLLLPAPSVFFGRVGFLSRSGVCRPFDAQADGYVRGEGAGVVVLRRLSDAEAAGDPILAVIRGSAANQNGVRNGLVAPSRSAQEALLRAALAAGRVSPAEVGYVEAMGVASPLADLVEVAAIGATYAVDRVVPVGSVKANVGHCEGAAGIASLLRAVEAVRVGVLPPTASHRKAPPELRAAGVRVPVEPEAWAAPRCAGVSAFGFSGTNVHVVIGEAPAAGPARRRAEPPPRRWAGRAHWADVAPQALAAERSAATGETAEPRLQPASCAPKDAASLAGVLAAEVAAILGRPVDTGAPLTSLGLDSLTVVELIRRIQQRTGLQIYPADVLGASSLLAVASAVLAPRQGGAERSTFLAACEHLGRAAPLPETEAKVTAGAPPVFLLSAPRAGSTLLRVLLGGHPALFAPPELHLLGFPELRARREKLGPQMLHLGLDQALMGLGASPEAARRTTEAWERDAAPVQAAYDALLGNGRVLVDKSPSYAFDPAVLRRAERLFAGPRYILLQRHPEPVRASFARLRMGRLFDLPSGLVEGEAAWTVATRNMRAFADTVDPARVHRIRYEDLLRDPERALRALTGFLGLPFDPAMLAPWEGDQQRMTGDLGFVGDPGFHRRSKLDTTLASPFDATAPPLQPETARLAWEEGYLPDARMEALAREAGIPTSLGCVVEGAPHGPPEPEPGNRERARARETDAPTLLTGATGFLGPWLLRALLLRLPGPVIVLVRAPDDAAARARVRDALRAVGASSLEGRVRALRADLAAAGLGLAPAARAELIETVGRVVHAAAQVNFVQPWEALAPSNIGGTREVLGLCQASGAALLHVSTKGVYGAGMWPGEGEIPEALPVPPPYRAASGYQESKWAAEVAVAAAARDGLAACWARVGRIGGDSRTGRAPADDLFVRFTRACLEISGVPDLPGAFEILPVDVVAGVLADLVAEKATGPLHVVHPAPVPIAALAAASPGYDLPILPYPAWRERLLARMREDRPGALAPLLSLFPPETPARVDDARLVPRRLLARGFEVEPVPVQMARLVAALRAE